jgi:hypothetical protein
MIFRPVNNVKRLIFLLMVAIPAVSWSQNLTISARVVDSENEENLGFASIGIKGIPMGTISNGQGEFDFHFPETHRNDILIVSMLGYKNYEAPIWTLIDNNVNVIRLEKSSIELQEIVVSDTLTGGDILRIALSRIEQNYPMEPFILDGFYRDVKKVGGTYISLLEAAVKIYDENYAEPRNKFKLRENVRLVEVRQSLGYESKFTKYFDQANLLEDLLLHNNIRYRQIEAEDALLASMSRAKNTVYNDQEMYVVTHTEHYNLKLFIEKQNFSIVHLEWETLGSNEELGKKKNLVSKFAGLKKTIDFKRHNGKMFLNFVTVNSKVNWYDIATNKLKFETELFQQLLINHVDAKPTTRIGSTEKMRNYGLQFQDQPYNKAFWDNYNVIKETPLDQQVLADLEKFSPLESQFQEY